MTHTRTALAIGGGIAGPVAAMALQRAGIEAVVYEARDAPSDYAGLFLNTASNGLDVLSTLDIDVPARADGDRKSTRLNSSHANISYAVFCLKKKDNV